MFRCYKQLEQSDCGITCIRMLARHYGAKIPLSYLRSISDISRLGMSVKDVATTLDALGFENYIIKIKTEHARAMPLPAILYWRHNHFVVLYKVSKNRFYVADPVRGKCYYSIGEFQDYWYDSVLEAGIAIAAQPSHKFNKDNYPKDSKIRQFSAYLLKFIRVNHRKLWSVAFLSLLIMAFDFATPLILSRTIDEGILHNDITNVIYLLCIQFVLIIAGMMIGNILNLLLTKTGLKIYMEMVLDFLDKLYKFPLSFYEKKHSSDLIQKIGDQNRIKNFLLNLPDSIVSILLPLIVFSCMLFHYSQYVFIIFMMFAIIEVIWNLLFYRKRKTIDYINYTKLSENHNHTYELTFGIIDLKTNNAGNGKIEKWRKTQQSLNNVTIKETYLNILQFGGRDTISSLKNLIITGVSAYMVIIGDMSLGVMMTLGYITGRLTAPFKNMGTLFSTLQESYYSFQRIEEIITYDSDNTLKESPDKACVIMDNIWFKYPGSGSPFILKDLSLTIEPFKLTALVGESGCGKSTLLKMMMGFYTPQKGHLKIGNVESNNLNNDAWLRMCGAVMQNGILFSGSIRENICFNNCMDDTDRINDILDTAGLLDFVISLPLGIDTLIGPAGMELSGGQKQRVLIARALYKDPDILFLDEATSFLDAKNEQSIVSKINSLSRQKTIVIAAHRLSTVRNADKIIFLKNGRVSESGTHDALMQLKGDYWDLVNRQLQSKTTRYQC